MHQFEGLFSRLGICGLYDNLELKNKQGKYVLSLPYNKLMLILTNILYGQKPKHVQQVQQFQERLCVSLGAPSISRIVIFSCSTSP